MLIGVLVDVSGSMRTILQIDSQPNDESITRSETIFHTIINIAKRETNFIETQEMFVIAFGMHYYDMATCDLMQLLRIAEAKQTNSITVKRALIKLLADNGAPYCHEYVYRYLKDKDAEFIYSFYSVNTHLIQKYIDNLPYRCKIDAINKAMDVLKSLPIIGCKYYLNIFLNISLPTFSFTIENREKVATEEHAIRAIKEAQLSLSQPRIVTFERAIDLIERNKNRLIASSERIKQLIYSISPYIFGFTPMCTALESAVNLFNESFDQIKSLFLLTDGEASDGNPIQYVQALRNNGVTVYVCLLVANNIDKPRKLYDEVQKEWTEAPKKMFELSSTVDNSNAAFSILLEKGWELPESGESRLFIQANHPIVIEEFTNLVIDMANEN